MIIRALLAFGGLVLGGLLGFGFGYWINHVIGHTKWIRTNGIVYDLIALFIAVAPYFGLCAGAAGGVKLLLWWADRKQDSHRIDAGQSPEIQMPEAPVDAAMANSDEAKRGRVILLSLIVAVLALDAFMSVLFLNSMLVPLSSTKGQAAIASRAVRFLLTLLLMSFVYRGNRVAKWISIALFGLAAVILVPLALAKLPFASLIVINGGFACSLLFSSDVRTFLEVQRSRRR